ncbi:MAG: response regulator transcription factor [Gammaproteobacteria bacterium]|jgi:two-component system response regulator RegA|nr:response regulator transcription factor [Gammaproteobacteria bacterium]
MNSPDPDSRPTILVVDDDEIFCGVLARSLERRGFNVSAARSVPEAQQLVQKNRPEFAVVDLRIGTDSGLQLIRVLAGLTPPTKSVVLTGYGSIATAVEAIKLGAIQYLTKPVEVDEILTALQGALPAVGETPPEHPKPLSVRRAEWEHIQRVLTEHGGNISAAARALGIHRRTLQRKLHKRPVRS